MAEFYAMPAATLRELRQLGYRVDLDTGVATRPDLEPYVEEAFDAAYPLRGKSISADPKPPLAPREGRMGEGLGALTSLRRTMDVPTAGVFSQLVGAWEGALGDQSHGAHMAQLRAESDQLGRERPFGAAAADAAGVGLATIPVSRALNSALGGTLGRAVGTGGAVGAGYGATDVATRGGDAGEIWSGAGRGALAGAATVGALRTAAQPIETMRDAGRAAGKLGRRVGALSSESFAPREYTMESLGFPTQNISIGLESKLDPETRAVLELAQGAIARTGPRTAPEFQQGNDDVWRASGGFVDVGAPDGMVRGVLSDAQARFRPAAEARIAQGRDVGGYLGDIFDHPMLYNRHPDLQGVPVHVSRDIEFSDYRPIDDAVRLRGGAPEEVRRAAIHETTHAVQERENFARGSGFVDPPDSFSPENREALYRQFADVQLRNSIDELTSDPTIKNAISYGESAERNAALKKLARLGRAAALDGRNIVRIRMNLDPLSHRTGEPIPVRDWLEERYDFSAGEKEAYRAEELIDLRPNDYRRLENRPTAGSEYRLPNVVRKGFP